MKKRIFSGVQPTGNLHIGNYLGAIRNWVGMQHDYESIFCIVDLHAITVYQQPAELRTKIEETAAIFLACGIDPQASSVMVQSSVSGHAELAWLLTCVTQVGWLQRMTQFKAKTEGQEAIGSGIMQYPILMAADILLYQAAVVPVGDDQSQHMELTRDIAQRFNSLYGETFVLPQTRLPMVGARVMGLDDPEKKMSKSEKGSGHAIGILDAPDVIKKKMSRATTDSNPHVDFETMGPGVANLLAIYQAFRGVSNETMQAEFSGLRYGDLKKKVTEAVVDGLGPVQARFAELTGDRAELHRILRVSADRVRPIAEDTLRLTRERMGLYSAS
jgi:tryptophanyl-tRNA synthetase